MWFRGFPTVLFVCLLGATALFAQTGGSAWEALALRNPALVEDESVSWRERLVLGALTPDQRLADDRECGFTLRIGYVNREGHEEISLIDRRPTSRSAFDWNPQTQPGDVLLH